MATSMKFLQIFKQISFIKNGQKFSWFNIISISKLSVFNNSQAYYCLFSFFLAFAITIFQRAIGD